MTFYALKTKGKFSFFCKSATLGGLDKEEKQAFYSWKGMQEKGNNKTMGDFLDNYERVKVTIENI